MFRRGRNEVGKAVAIVAGLVIAAIGEFIGMMLAAAGHGWTQPILYSLLLFVAWPATLLRLPRPEGTSARFDLFIFVLGGVATLVLFIQSAGEAEYIWKLTQHDDLAVPVMITWLLFWFGWQALTAVNIIRRRRYRQTG
jgi:hypothetical protein